VWPCGAGDLATTQEAPLPRRSLKSWLGGSELRVNPKRHPPTGPRVFHIRTGLRPSSHGSCATRPKPSPQCATCLGQLSRAPTACRRAGLRSSTGSRGKVSRARPTVYARDGSCSKAVPIFLAFPTIRLGCSRFRTKARSWSAFAWGQSRETACSTCAPTLEERLGFSGRPPRRGAIGRL
jgi:hypothetical protein